MQALPPPWMGKVLGPLLTPESPGAEEVGLRPSVHPALHPAWPGPLAVMGPQALDVPEGRAGQADGPHVPTVSPQETLHPQARVVPPSRGGVAEGSLRA